MKTVSILLCFVFFSCASSDFRKKDLLEINHKMNVEIQNQPTNIGGVDFLELFGISHKATDVKISFDDSGDLRIVYNNPDFKKPQQQVFKGKLKKKYFEIYFEKKNVFFPPVYCKTKIDRLRIAIAKDSTLFTQRFYESSGMFLLMAAGTSYNSYNRFAINPSLKK